MISEGEIYNLQEELAEDTKSVKVEPKPEPKPEGCSTSEK